MHVGALPGLRVVVAFCVSVLIAGQAAAEPGGGANAARQVWMTGYLKLERAATAADDGRTALALQLFEEAAAVFHRVQREYPDWKPQLVSYRITFCDVQIRALRETAALGLEDMSSAQLRSEVQRLRHELKAPTVRIERLEATVARLEKETAAAVAARVAVEKVTLTAIAAREEAESRLAALSRRVDDLETDLAERQAKVAWLEKAVNSAASLRTTIADLKARAQAAADLEAQLADLRLKQEVWRREKERLQAAAEHVDRVQRERDAMRGERDSVLATAVKSQGARKEAEMALKVAEIQRDRERAMAATAMADRARLEKECARLSTLSTAAREAVVRLPELNTALRDVRRQAEAARAVADARAVRLERSARDLQDLRAKVAALSEQLAAARVVDMESLRARQAETDTRLSAALTGLRQAEEQVDALKLNEQRLALTATREREQQAAEATRAAAIATHMAAAAAATKEGHLREAGAQLRKVVELNPDHAEALYQLGAVLAGVGNDEGAEQILKRALRRRSDDADLLLRLGVVLLRREKVREAVATLLRGTALVPSQAEMRHFLGVALSQLGWHGAAEEALREAFELDNTNAVTAYDLAVLLVSTESPRSTEARSWYDRALALGTARDAALERALGVGAEPAP